ncbi:hypothetical protein [Sphingomonas sp. LM7]|uniref:hypothetical protein n=1 Tax=Sphingomonas sp. LM7 TaxID=1938607 RepID=UPI000983A32F|nr:hypothetical protein [Sphingomonas sp. LM7]AQR74757.1 hypothetical protein BXU08_14830 [Sphingomonas sp. LM7]
MRKTIFALLPALALGLAACSESAEDNLSATLDRTGASLENAANDAGDTIANATDDAGRELDNFADDVGQRAEGVGNAIDNATR